MARAKQFASRIAKSLDQKGVIMRSSIRMAQPCCSLTTLNVIIAYHRKWAARNSYFATSIGAGRFKLHVTIHSTTQRIGGVDLYQTFFGGSGS
jgi:predicted transcriptional regulator